MKRMGMVIGLRAEFGEEYFRLHAQPWPAVLETLRKCNIQNYVIYHHAGLLFAHLEYHGDDWAADQRKMAADPTTQAWWKLTIPCQIRLPTTKAGEWWASMDEVFFLGER
jgi:L-rhamnose mutarotase